MNVRHWLGDIGLAVLLALPTATLAGPSAVWKSRPAVAAPQVQLAAAAPSAFAARPSYPG